LILKVPLKKATERERDVVFWKALSKIGEAVLRAELWYVLPSVSSGVQFRFAPPDVSNLVAYQVYLNQFELLLLVSSSLGTCRGTRFDEC
jgi:hypothetical protein